MEKEKLYINGEWVDGVGKEWIEVENPATGEILACVPDGGKEDVERAVLAAKKGFQVWKNTHPTKRAEILHKMGDYLEENRSQIGEVITAELGAPVKMVREWHVDGCIAEARYFAELASHYPYEQEIPGALLCREPVGIVAAVTPWNYPLNQITVKVLPALAAGNSVILKPSQTAPLSAFCFAKAAEAAGLPKGVFNIVTGRGGQVGNFLAMHPEISMISFTGSTEAGKAVARMALENIKKISLELGGKSACVLLPSGNLERAVGDTLQRCFMNTGQTCSATTRFFVPKDQLKQVEQLLIERAKRFVVGEPQNPNTDIGPLVSKKQLDTVKRYVNLGINEGARMIFGEIPEQTDGGYYVKPVIFSDVKNNMQIAQEEIFGPVLCVIPYESEEEALCLANDSIYGLSGSVFGEKQKALNFAKKMETGNVHINGAPLVSGAPFGGYKQSGLGRENDRSSFEEFMESKAILVKEYEIK